MTYNFYDSAMLNLPIDFIEVKMLTFHIKHSIYQIIMISKVQSRDYRLGGGKRAGLEPHREGLLPSVPL